MMLNCYLTAESSIDNLILLLDLMNTLCYSRLVIKPSYTNLMSAMQLLEVKIVIYAYIQILKE